MHQQQQHVEGSCIVAHQHRQSTALCWAIAFSQQQQYEAEAAEATKAQRLVQAMLVWRGEVSLTQQQQQQLKAADVNMLYLKQPAAVILHKVT